VSRADVACHNNSVIKIKNNNVGNNKQFKQRKYASLYHEIILPYLIQDCDGAIMN
jgi:hypothetical protein